VVFATAERDADPAKIVADQKLFDETTRSGVRLQAALCALDLLMP
jgi:nicotinamide-nucleotide amidase